jgi:cation transport ATPase
VKPDQPATPAPPILHETRTRLRARYAAGADAAELRTRLAQQPGVRDVRVSASIRSVTVEYDGRSATREAVLQDVAGATIAAPVAAAAARERMRNAALPPWVAAAATLAIPALPAAGRTAVALALTAGDAWLGRARGAPIGTLALDTLGLATTALTGNPFTTATSILLASASQRLRDGMLADLDRLLAHLTPAEDRSYRVTRVARRFETAASSLDPGDRIALGPGHVVPADGVVARGRARLDAATHRGVPSQVVVGRGDRLGSGKRLAEGAIVLVVERPAARSRAARLREHVRHALSSREQPGQLTPDLDRLLALPATAAGLVLALTHDAGRSAAMLHADPQRGLALAHPVARETAMYALARHGVLIAGLEAIDRLATATTFAFEDIGILTESAWHVAAVETRGSGVDRARVRRWLDRLAGADPKAGAETGLPDHAVNAWIEHGGVVRDGARVLHVGGGTPIRRTWGLAVPDPSLRGLERRLGIVEGGRLIAVVSLRCRLRDAVAAHVAALRALGVLRVAVFTEALGAKPPTELAALGVDTVISLDRHAQARWLAEAAERGEQVALVHNGGLRALLPPGGLSLCSTEAEAGAHGVLLGDPLGSLVAARAAAGDVRARLRLDFGLAMGANSLLLVASGLRLVPPIATASLNHLFSFALLARSLAIAGIEPPLPEATAPSPDPSRMEEAS